MKEKYEEALNPKILEYSKIGKKIVLNIRNKVNITVLVLSACD
jgi:hypothetical protein